MKDWKKFLMLIVIIGGLVCMLLSFVNEQVVTGIISFLTVLVPVVIWFSDDKENQERDDKFIKLKEDVESYGMKLIDNPEWIYAITDAADHLLFGIHRHDGSIEWGAGVPRPIREEISELKKRIAELEKK